FCVCGCCSMGGSGFLRGCGGGCGCWSSSSRSSCWLGDLHELEGHAIALANRQVLLFVFVTEPQCWWKRPHAFGMVLGVLCVRIELGLARELEAGGFDLLDGPL